MTGRAVGLLVWLLVICGLCSPSAASKRLPRWLDVVNIIIRLILLILYCLNQMMMPSTIPQLATKTYQVQNMCLTFILI